ncbi:MAG TPA: anti-sigma factor [Pyrinomonadaceae bacterium]|jgi:anti-sigma-K factor RskA|nr:anti-sigma factor [Pyrinomonadaceae bacterium]
MNHETYKEMLSLDALGVLDGEDARTLRAHLDACAECRAEAHELRLTASMLAHTVAPVAPPEHLRARILASIETDAARDIANANETASARASEKSRTAVDSPVADASATNVLPFVKGQNRSGFVVGKPAFAFGAIAASLAIIALSATLLTVWQRNKEMRAEMARLGARADQLAARADLSEQQLARAREEREMLTAPGARIVALAGTKAAPDAHATVAFDPRTGSAMLLAADLPPAPAGKAYQLWFIAGGRAPMPGKVFNTDASGRGTLRDRVPAEATAAPTFAVTLEPSGGTSAPTSEPYLVGKAS